MRNIPPVVKLWGGEGASGIEALVGRNCGFISKDVWMWCGGVASRRIAKQ